MARYEGKLVMYKVMLGVIRWKWRTSVVGQRSSFETKSIVAGFESERIVLDQELKGFCSFPS